MREGSELTPLDGTGVLGAVLIGGASRRMGQPKAVVRVPEGGPTMLERVVTAVSACTTSLVLVGTEQSVVPGALTHTRVVHDRGIGPVGGLIAALEASNHPRVLLTACDMPFLSPEVLRMVIAHSIETGEGACVVVRNGDGAERLQPLIAVYGRDDLDEIRNLFRHGARSLIEIVQSLNMERVDLLDILPWDTEMWSVFNVNTPEQLAMARRHAETEDRLSDDILR